MNDSSNTVRKDPDLLCQNVGVVGFRPQPHLREVAKTVLRLSCLTQGMIHDLQAEGDRAESSAISSYLHTLAYRLELHLKEIQSVSETIERLPCSAPSIS